MNIQSRWAAFGIHLAISFLVLLVLLAVIFFVWFPHDLIFAGGIGGLKILTGVDLVLGPVLTLLVFKHGKPSLKMDLSVIAVIQIGCLLAGLWLIFNERPMVQVLADDGIHLLASSDLEYYDMPVPEVAGNTPKYVMLDLPEDRDQLGSIKFTSEFVEEKPFVFRDDLYLSMIEQSTESFKSRIEFIQQVIPEDYAASLPEKRVVDCHWLPLHSKHATGYACVSYEGGIVQLSERRFFQGEQGAQ